MLPLILYGNVLIQVKTSAETNEPKDKTDH